MIARESAIIPEDRLPLLIRYDTKSAHYDVVSINPPAIKIGID